LQYSNITLYAEDLQSGGTLPALDAGNLTNLTAMTTNEANTWTAGQTFSPLVSGDVTGKVVVGSIQGNESGLIISNAPLVIETRFGDPYTFTPFIMRSEEHQEGGTNRSYLRISGRGSPGASRLVISPTIEHRGVTYYREDNTFDNVWIELLRNGGNARFSVFLAPRSDSFIISSAWEMFHVWGNAFQPMGGAVFNEDEIDFDLSHKSDAGNTIWHADGTTENFGIGGTIVPAEQLHVTNGNLRVDGDIGIDGYRGFDIINSTQLVFIASGVTNVLDADILTP